MEVFLPFSRMTYRLPSITGKLRVRHTLTGNVVCGGSYRDTDDNCLILTETGEGWKPYSQKLKQPRLGHSAWASPQGIVLMGGYDSSDTTELVTSGGTTMDFLLNRRVR